MLRFEKIDFSKNLEVCVSFREDSHRVSFPDSDDWDRYWKPAEYVGWLKLHAVKYPDGAVHIWSGPTIIGQLEFAYGGDNGHVNLYYLIPCERRKGLGRLAHDFICHTLLQHGCTTASLRVSPSNHRAVKFYARTGWQDQGADQKYPQVNLYKLVL